MKHNCPNSSCLNFKTSTFVTKDGSYFRACDSRKIQRFKCKKCLKKFSSSTHSLEFRQKKRRQNPMLFKLLASGVSMRRSAHILRLSPHTVARRLRYFGVKSRRAHQKRLQALKKNKVLELQFDDLITKENSKLKPLSISVAVDAKRRIILGAYVSRIPSFGHLAKKSRLKYGRRECEHKQGLSKLFCDLKPIIDPYSKIASDQHKKYPQFVKSHFPKADYTTFESERGCIVGQGELKKVRFDPLFVINHTCALFRANINRLVRKTWCTTKDVERLKDHLDLFIDFFNRSLMNKMNINTT